MTTWPINGHQAWRQSASGNLEFVENVGPAHKPSLGVRIAATIEFADMSDAWRAFGMAFREAVLAAPKRAADCGFDVEVINRHLADRGPLPEPVPPAIVQPKVGDRVHYYCTIVDGSLGGPFAAVVTQLGSKDAGGVRRVDLEVWYPGALKYRWSPVACDVPFRREPSDQTWRWP